MTSLMYSRSTDGDGPHFLHHQFHKNSHRRAPHQSCQRGNEETGEHSLTLATLQVLCFPKPYSDFHFNTGFNACKRLRLLFHYRPVTLQ
ncbi:Hypothetical predicted protein [Xyrichtys novacula]|uniref:Uncharacterized protein n=1 Tax=Xyrichtys novacula TaxID=13765 RepID=A0AAV1EVI1_XYRNO|nr:Hypothetical predicted protein [Xyrichtys novacula]